VAVVKLCVRIYSRLSRPGPGGVCFKGDMLVGPFAPSQKCTSTEELPVLGLALQTAALNGARCDAVAYDFAQGHSLARGLQFLMQGFCGRTL